MDGVALLGAIEEAEAPQGEEVPVGMRQASQAAREVEGAMFIEEPGL
jgi:hypothetical protein